MAKVYEEVIIIKVSKLVKDDADIPLIATDEVTVALEQVAQELVGSGVIVEIERA